MAEDRIPISPPPVGAEPQIVTVRIHHALALEVQRWANRTIGRMSASAAVAVALREALPLLYQRQDEKNFAYRDDHGEADMHIPGGEILGPVEDKGNE